MIHQTLSPLKPGDFEEISATLQSIARLFQNRDIAGVSDLQVSTAADAPFESVSTDDDLVIYLTQKL